MGRIDILRTITLALKYLKITLYGCSPQRDGLLHGRIKFIVQILRLTVKNRPDRLCPDDNLFLLENLPE